MSLIDPDTGAYSDAAFGFDTQTALAGQPSLMESIGNVITKGIPLTALSVVNSFANTAIEVGNFFGADIPKWSTDAEMDAIGATSYKDYYDTHSQGIEAAGLLAGSLIPGMIGVKALKLAQLGKMGEVMQRATSIFSAPRDAIIADAMSTIKAGDSSLFGALTASKYKAIALGAGDQALQALVFETAVAGTMKASPLLDDQSLGDVATNMFYGVLLGGGVGGALEGISTRAMLNRALISADTATKDSEVTTRFGFGSGATYKGTSIAGDQVVQLMHSVDQIPDDLANNLAQKKAVITRDNSVLDSKLILSQLAGKGNEDVASSMFDTLMRMKASGQDKDEIYNYLAGLAKVSRIDQPSVVPSGDSFFINRFAPKQSYDFSDIVTSAPLKDADLSLKYELTSFASTPRIAKATDIYTDITGAEQQRYFSVADAWQDNADIYIDKNLAVHVNPDAPNIAGRTPREGEGRVLTNAEERTFRETGTLPEGSKPLTGAPIILNTLDGNISSSAAPVVGDYGRPTFNNRGLAYGDKFSPQSASVPLTADTSTIDANARYVWASKRGIRNGDTIDINDIPMLEQLYREATAAKVNFSDYMQETSRRGVTLSNDTPLPLSTTDLLNTIRNAKDDLIHDLISKDSKLSSEEVAIRANVPEKYIANGFSAQAPEDYMVPTSQWEGVNHVKMEYDIGNTHTNDGMILRGLLDSQYRIQTIVDAAKAATAKEFGENYKNFLAEGVTSRDATITGAKAGFLSFANSDYGTLGQKMERIGRFVTNLLQERMGDYSKILAPAANAIRDDQTASAELGAFIAVRRRTGETFTFLPPELAAKYNMSENTAVLSKSLLKDKTGAVVDWNRDYTPDGFLPGRLLSDRAGEVDNPQLHTYYPLSDTVATFERAQAQVNDSRVVSRNNWYAAQGISRTQELGTLYAPPLDTAKYPHFAYVKAKEGAAFSTDDTAVITAESAADLEQKIAALSPDYSIYTKDMLAKYHQVEGDYQYNRNFADSRVNSDLARRGILNDVFPDTRADTIVQQYIDFNTRQETRLVRDYVELGNNQLFAELGALGERFAGAETSQTGYLSKIFSRSVENPYDSYIKTALAIGPRDEYRLWAGAQEKLEAFASSAFRMAKSAFTGAQQGLISYEEASAVMQKAGLGNPYQAATDAMGAYYNVANKLPPTNILSRIVGTANAITSATAIRLDAWQSAINIISSPILTMAEGRSILGKMDPGILATELPDGSGRAVPSVTKAMFTAVKNWWTPEVRDQWLPLYKQMGIVRDVSSEYFEMINNLALPLGKGWSESAITNNLKSAVDTASKFTGSQWTENFVRFMAADVARQIYTAAGTTGTDLIDNIGTFVNRVHGNYIASQRPVAFQGPIGQAASLFQTYQFNLFQQLFRYVEDGEHKTLGLMAAMQGGLFGAQSLPGIQFINQHIVGDAAGNPSHKDLYSTATNFFDKKLGDYLLYGVASNWLGTGLYSRGDINPRQISILPLNPLEFPAISGGINFISNLMSTADKVVQGASFSQAIMNGLEHNGISRPLSGLGQIMQGYVSTAKGDLVAATRPQMGDNSSGWNDVISAANMTRLAGARPLDEAINMDMLYRSTLYEAKDTSRIERLGAAVKEGLAGNEPLDPVKLQTFMTEYTNAGGQIQRFGQEMMRWTQEANVSKANMIFRNLQKPLAQQQMIQMGGQPLPDFQNRGNTAAPPIPSSVNTTQTQTVP